MTKTMVKNEFELIAKHCPQCEALIMARVEKKTSGETQYSGEYCCSGCSWKNNTRTAG